MGLNIVVLIADAAVNQSSVHKLRLVRDGAAVRDMTQDIISNRNMRFRDVYVPHLKKRWLRIPPEVDDWALTLEPQVPADSWESISPALFLFAYLLADGVSLATCEQRPPSEDVYLAVSAEFQRPPPEDVPRAMQTPLDLPACFQRKLDAYYAWSEFNALKCCLVTGNSSPNYQGFEQVQCGGMEIPSQAGHYVEVCQTLSDLVDLLKSGELRTLKHQPEEEQRTLI